MKTQRPRISKTNWRRRPAFRLNNGVVEMTLLTGGGHIADFRLLDSASRSINAMWEAPWLTMDPDQFASTSLRKNVRTYGEAPVGKYLAAFTGHTVCVDYFGAPSEAEAARGLSLHGEAANSRWKLKKITQGVSEARLCVAVPLPAAGLRFQRELSVRRNESVVYVEEAVTNLREQDHFFHWVQHVTLGLPLLHPDESLISLSGSRAITWPHGYEGANLLPDNQEFTWPHATSTDGSPVDLSRPFVRDGLGFVVAVLFDPQRKLGFVTALNSRLGLVLGYGFRRADFPWIAIWEENVARQSSPWNGTTRARGLEFGTTPMPIGKEEGFARGSLFDAPTFRRIPAKSDLRVPYVAFLSRVNSGWRSIRDVQFAKDRIILTEQRGEQLEMKATGLKNLGLDGS